MLSITPAASDRTTMETMNEAPPMHPAIWQSFYQGEVINKKLYPFILQGRVTSDSGRRIHEVL